MKYTSRSNTMTILFPHLFLIGFFVGIFCVAHAFLFRTEIDRNDFTLIKAIDKRDCHLDGSITITDRYDN